MSTEPSPSLLERLELQASERGLLLRLQVVRLGTGPGLLLGLGFGLDLGPGLR